ncbi:hypothetical protein [Botrimarina hoheduenensis]|uniref:Uncharacterized protein n=1 Tax=Botrimarina hoheduenensis TaxID=2528000 RepID=A0A5C5VY27_9BACT|nr:hypothetical protein [Botrimarina hoheduenensis]TWT43334.1 hypothetical protein Pla111_22850 [Botrimarina hoheduenensis]
MASSRSPQRRSVTRLGLERCEARDLLSASALAIDPGVSDSWGSTSLVDRALADSVDILAPAQGAGGVSITGGLVGNDFSTTGAFSNAFQALGNGLDARDHDAALHGEISLFLSPGLDLTLTVRQTSPYEAAGVAPVALPPSVRERIELSSPSIEHLIANAIGDAYRTEASTAFRPFAVASEAMRATDYRSSTGEDSRFRLGLIAEQLEARGDEVWSLVLSGTDPAAYDDGIAWYDTATTDPLFDQGTSGYDTKQESDNGFVTGSDASGSQGVSVEQGRYPIQAKSSPGNPSDLASEKVIADAAAKSADRLLLVVDQKIADESFRDEADVTQPTAAWLRPASGSTAEEIPRLILLSAKAASADEVTDLPSTTSDAIDPTAAVEAVPSSDVLTEGAALQAGLIDLGALLDAPEPVSHAAWQQEAVASQRLMAIDLAFALEPWTRTVLLTPLDGREASPAGGRELPAELHNASDPVEPAGTVPPAGARLDDREVEAQEDSLGWLSRASATVGGLATVAAALPGSLALTRRRPRSRK